MGFMRGSWLQVKGHAELIKRGFELCKLGKIQDAAFQRVTLLECMRRTMLKNIEASKLPANEDVAAGPDGDVRNSLDGLELPGTLLEVLTQFFMYSCILFGL